MFHLTNSQHSSEGTCLKKVERRIHFLKYPPALQKYFSPPLISCSNKLIYFAILCGFFYCFLVSLYHFRNHWSNGNGKLSPKIYFHSNYPNNWPCSLVNRELNNGYIKDAPKKFTAKVFLQGFFSFFLCFVVVFIVDAIGDPLPALV